MQSIGSLLGGFGIAFYRGPVFSAVCLAYFPIMLLTVLGFSKSSKRAAYVKMMANKDLGGFTEEALSALKVTVSFA